MEEQGFKSKPTFKDMMNDVVAYGSCCECGTCVLVCPHNVIEYIDSKPKQTAKESAAFDYCGISDEEFHLFLGRDLRDDGRVQREITEQIELELVPLAELHQRVLRGDVLDGPSALAILLAHELIEA